jgi:3-methylfumaryl-CoA hydratase
MSVSDAEIAGYSDWIGRESQAQSIIAPESGDLMAATLDRADPKVSVGDPVPPMWLQMAFRPDAPRSEIGPDGHTKRGSFLPPVALPRRMYGGARYRYHAPLPYGAEITRTARVAGVEAKRGGSGLMVVVTVTNSYHSGGILCVEDGHDILYREAADPNAPPPPAPEPRPIPDAPWAETWVPDPVTLFRYSALTFNGHRIHYDRSYVTQEEGYPGLVVHGPLTATLLSELCRRSSGGRALAAFSYRARSPLFDTGPVHLRGTADESAGTAQLSAYSPTGHLAMSAEAVFE